MSPTASVRGPKYVVKRGKTPVLKAEQARTLLDSIDTGPIVGLRDRALLGVMGYTFARVSAVTPMRVEDYHQNGIKRWFRLHEKGGKRHEVPAHHNADECVHAYLEAAGTADPKKTPLFRSADKHHIKRRAKAAGLPDSTCCHTSALPASPPIWKTAAPSRTPRPLPPTNSLAPPSCMTAPGMRLRWMRWNES
jgi:integrase/recombinase XerD